MMKISKRVLIEKNHLTVETFIKMIPVTYVRILDFEFHLKLVKVAFNVLNSLEDNESMYFDDYEEELKEILITLKVVRFIGMSNETESYIRDENWPIFKENFLKVI